MNDLQLPTLKKPTPDSEKKFTLRYKELAPYGERPHAPTVPRFDSFDEALEWLEEQDNSFDLEVVRR